MSEQQQLRNDRIDATESAIQQVREIVATLSDNEKAFLTNNSIGYRHLYHAFRADFQSELTAAQQRVAELERLLRGIQQDAKLGDDEYHVSMSLIMAIDDHIGLNAGEQVIVPNYAADNARLRSAIKEAIERSNGRYDEWGERAQMCFEILQAAIGE